jgi:polysaccharide export outer membrane protein
MSKRTFIIFAAVFSLSAVFSILALAQTQSQSLNMGPDLANPMDNQGVRRYRVGPGDLLDVRVFGQPDLSSTVEIDDDGNISSLPFIEDPIPAKCRTEREIQKSITEAYSRYLIKPRISVRISERRSRPPAVIFGAVRAPTRVQMMRRVRLHELLALAGGITGGASGTIQIMHTEKEMCPEPGDLPEQIAANIPVAAKTAGTSNEAKATTTTDPKTTSPKAANDQDPKNAAAQQDPTGETRASIADIGELEVFKIDTLKAGGFSMTATGIGSNDPFIRPGDIVIVTEGLPIYIMGGVVAPREITLKDKLTLSRALAMAGGVQKLANASQIHIYRHREGQGGQDHLTFNYDKIKKGTDPDPFLQAYDIIDVRMKSQWSAASLGDFFLNMSRSSMGFMSQRVVY